MTIEEKLKECILSKYKSIRDFTIKANIPYSTIENALKRGISGTSVSTVIKICELLNIDTESLAKGLIVPRTAPDATINFSSKENLLVNKYRQLDIHGQKAIEAITDIELERETNSEETTNIKKVLQDDELKLITAYRQLTDEGKDKIMQCMIQTVTEIPYQRDEYKVEHVMNVPKDYDPETDEFTYIPVSAFGHGISFIKMSKIISEFNEIKHAALLEQEDDQPDF